MPPERIEPGPGQESVWDYPRPPRVEPVGKRVHVRFNGIDIADTTRALRVLETSHPPTYYIPFEDIRMELMERTRRSSACEWKGRAEYYSVRVGERYAPHVAWGYPAPAPGFVSLERHLAFYPSKVDACFVDGERVASQPGDFYGGWITGDLAGPFKGGPGTWGW